MLRAVSQATGCWSLLLLIISIVAVQRRVFRLWTVQEGSGTFLIKSQSSHGSDVFLNTFLVFRNQTFV